MPAFDPLSQRLAFAASAVDRHPAELDAERIEDVALAIGRMTPAQRELLGRLVDRGHDALFEQVVTVQHIVNDVRRARTAKSGGQFFEAYLRPDDLVRGFRFHAVASGVQALGADDKKALADAVGKGDTAATAAFLQKVGFDSEREPIHWVQRVFRAFPDDGVTRIDRADDGLGVVSIRGKPSEQIPQLEAQLAELVDRLAASPSNALRQRAADTFASLMNASMMLSKREHGLRPNLAGWFERLGSVGAPGFLPKRAEVHHDVPLVAGAVTTEHRFSPEAQVVGLKLQLGRVGGGLDYERPGGGTVILVGDDERYLGKPNAPLGVVKDDHVIVPKRVEADLFVETMPGHERKLGALELPYGKFRVGTRLHGYALRLPLKVDVGGATFALREGAYVSAAKDAEVVPGRPIRLRANGVEKTIDPTTGEVG